MTGNGIHSRNERNNMTGHDEYQEQQLRAEEQLAPETAHQHFTCIRHARDVRVPQFELSDHVTGVRA